MDNMIEMPEGGYQLSGYLKRKEQKESVKVERTDRSRPYEDALSSERVANHLISDTSQMGTTPSRNY